MLVLQRPDRLVVACALDTVHINDLLGGLLQHLLQLLQAQVAIGSQHLFGRSLTLLQPSTVLLQPAREGVDLFPDVGRFAKLEHELEQLLHGDHPIVVLVHEYEHPEVDEAQTGVGCVVDQRDVLFEAELAGEAEEVEEFLQVSGLNQVLGFGVDQLSGELDVVDELAAGCAQPPSDELPQRLLIDD